MATCTAEGIALDQPYSASTTFTMPANAVTVTARWSRIDSGGGNTSSSRPTQPPEPSGPSSSSTGWDDIADEIADSQDGETITIDMSGETEVPGEIFEEVAGKDVDVTFELEGGLSWTVSGQDVPAGTSFSSVNLGVSMGTSGIPVSVINAVTGGVSAVQITLTHDGAFGFTLTLTATLSRENAGHWANLYHYDEDAGAMAFETAVVIDSNGDVSLRSPTPASLPL